MTGPSMYFSFVKSGHELRPCRANERVLCIKYIHVNGGPAGLTDSIKYSHSALFQLETKRIDTECRIFVSGCVSSLVLCELHETYGLRLDTSAPRLRLHLAVAPFAHRGKSAALPKETPYPAPFLVGICHCAKFAETSSDMLVCHRCDSHPHLEKARPGGVGGTRTGHPDSYLGDPIGARGVATTPTMK